MATFHLQQGLPISLKNKAVPVRGHFAWHYKEAKELLEWLKLHNYIITTIQLFSDNFLVTFLYHKFFRRSWYYHGDRKKGKEENIAFNFRTACLFIEESHLKTSKLMYRVFFTSEGNMDEVDKDFFFRSLIITNEYNYELDDALLLIERCREIGKEILGIEVFKLTDTDTYPLDVMDYSSGYENIDPTEYFERFHVEMNTDVGHWKEAIQYIKDRAFSGVYFQIIHK